MKIISGQSKTTINHIETNKKNTTTTKNAVITTPKKEADLFQNQAIKKEDLLALAKDLNNGSISSSEAKDRFIETIVKNRLEDKLCEKDVKAINDAVKQVYGDDATFTKNLVKNLRSLS